MDKQELIDRLEKAIKEHSPPLLEPEEVEYLKGLLEQEQRIRKIIESRIDGEDNMIDTAVKLYNEYFN